MPDYRNRRVPSTGMTVDTDEGPVDLVALDRVRSGMQTRLTKVEKHHLDQFLTSDMDQVVLVAEGLGVSQKAVRSRISRYRTTTRSS